MRRTAVIARGELLAHQVLFWRPRATIAVMRAGKGRGASAATGLLLCLVFSCATPAYAEGGDGLLAGFHGAKIGLAALVAGTALTEPATPVAEGAVLGVAALLVALPSTMVLIEKRRRDADALRRWRISAFVVDAALAATAAAYGAWLVADPGSGIDSQYAGLACLSAALAWGLLSRLDLVPFMLERTDPLP